MTIGTGFDANGDPKCTETPGEIDGFPKSWVEIGVPMRFERRRNTEEMREIVAVAPGFYAHGDSKLTVTPRENCVICEMGSRNWCPHEVRKKHKPRGKMPDRRRRPCCAFLIFCAEVSVLLCFPLGFGRFWWLVQSLRRPSVIAMVQKPRENDSNHSNTTVTRQ